MNRSKAIDKAIKLKALAERGVGGEAVNAKAQLERMMRDYNLTATDIDDETETHDAGVFGYVKTDKRKFDDGEVVLVHQRVKMIVCEAYPTLKGWRYVLRFINKNGTPNKRQSAWGLNAKDIQKMNEIRLGA